MTGKQRIAAEVSPSTTELQVWKRTRPGHTQRIGTINASATKDDFVRTFSAHMPPRGSPAEFKFLLYPFNARGESTAHWPIQLTLTGNDPSVADPRRPDPATDDGAFEIVFDAGLEQVPRGLAERAAVYNRAREAELKYLRDLRGGRNA